MSKWTSVLFFDKAWERAFAPSCPILFEEIFKDYKTQYFDVKMSWMASQPLEAILFTDKSKTLSLLFYNISCLIVYIA